MLELYAAMAKVQKEIKNAPKDCKNPHFGSRYASLGSVIDTVKPTLERCGLIFIQCVRGTALVTRIVHVATGQELEDQTPLLLAKQDPQALGSAITYARRYSLSNICGIVSEDDDDGNASVSRPEPKPVVTVHKTVDAKAESENKAATERIKGSLNTLLGFKGKVEVKP